MKDRFFLVVALSAMAVMSGGCRKTKSRDAVESGPAPVIAPELKSNALGSLPGPVYGSQVDSPIHWQGWTKASLERAKAARRLVFVVIAMPQQPVFQQTLTALSREPAVVAHINENYVPILVDGDAAREIGLLTADLCAEIKRPLQMPVFLWMTYEGNPVAWIPVASSDPASVLGLFNQSHTMVTQMWNDSPDYVLKNSAMDNEARRKRLEQRKVSKVMSEQPAVDALRSLRHLAALYDPYSRSFDEAGGLFPSGALDLLATAAVHPGLPPDVRARTLETTRELLVDLLPSAMFDPLDGGVFSSRRGQSWSLPSFTRDCPGQARAALALLQAYRATGDAQALEKALGLIAFAEKAYVTEEGLFAVGLTPATKPEQWMWSVEDIEKTLKPEDAAWWIKATGMKGLGNLPSEIDPQRKFFRANTVGLIQSPAAIAAGLSLTPEAFAPRFQAVKAQLLAARDARIGKTSHDEASHAVATFRMVSAYASAFGVTGDEGTRIKAVALLKRARQAFSVEPRLRLFSKDAPDSLGTGRAFLYALALQAVIDVASITTDEQWLIWSEDLATAAAEYFTGQSFLRECPDEAKLIDLPVTDLVMLFDDSTAGLVSSAECRLAQIGRPLVTSFSELATPLPVYAVDRPVLHTDLLLATLARHFKVTIVLGANLPPAMKLAAERLPMRVMPRRPARPGDEVPVGSIKVLLSEGRSRIVSTPDALREAVLP